MAVDSDVVWVPTLPSLSDFARELDKGTKGAGRKTGERVGREIADGVAKSQAAVDKAAEVAEKAHNRVADAAGKVRIAEEQLTKARASGDSIKIARAEEQLATARRRQGEATTTAENADKTLASRRERLTKVTQDSATAAREQADAIELGAGAMDGMGGKVSALAGKLGGLAAGFAGVAGAAGLAMTGFDVDAQIDLVNRQLGLTGEAARMLGDEVGQVMRSGVAGSAEDAAQAVGALSSQFRYLGFEGEQTATELSDNFLAFTKTFDVDMAEATQTAGQLIQNGLAADVESAADLMTAAMQRVPAQMRDELPEIINEYGTNFRALGFTGEESFGILVSAAEQGKWALDKTGDSLKEFTIRGADMSKASTEAYQLIGLNAEEMSAKVAAGGAGAREALMATAQGLLGVENPAERANAAIALFGTPLEDLSVDQIPAFLEGLSGADAAMVGFEGSSQALADQMANSLQGRMDALKGTVSDLAGDAFMRLWDITQNQLIPTLQATGDWLQRNEAWVGPLAAAVGAAATAWGLWTLAVKGWQTATKIATAVQAAFNAVMAANPIMLIVIAVAALAAGLTYFFTQTEVGQRAWEGFLGILGKAKDFFVDIIDFGKMVASVLFGGDFQGNAPFGLQEDSALVGWLFTIRETVLAVWDGIKSAFSAAWAFVQPIFTGFKVAFAIIVTAALLVWEGVKLYWTLVGNIVVWAWNTLIKPTFDAVKVGLQAVGVFFGWVWSALIQPAWNALGVGIAWVWNAVIRPTWDLLKAALGAVGSAFQWVWSAIIKPTWDALGAGIQWVWATVISPTWDALKFALGAVGDFFSWVWNSVIKPAWDALGAGIRWVADNVVHPVFEGLKTGLSRIETAFQKAVDFIGQMWDRIKAITAKPVKFVIDTVYNNGIRAVWNKVAGWLGLEELPEWRPEWLGAYASGTAVLPGYSPGRDNMLFTSHDGRAQIALGGGEGIARPEVVRAMGPNAFDALNESARRGGVSAVRRQLGEGAAFNRGGIVDLGAFADGGTLADAAIARVFDIMRRENGKPYQYGGVGNPSWDCSGLWSGIYQELTGGSMFGGRVFTTESDFESFGFVPGANGRVSIGVMRGGGGPNSHMAGTIDGINIESGGSGGVQFGGTAQGTADFPLQWTLAELGGRFIEGVRGAGGGGSVIGSLVRQAFDTILKPIIDSIPAGPGLFGGLGQGLGNKIADSVKDFLLSKVPLGGGSPAVDVSGIDGPTVDVFQKVFEQFGWTGDQWEAAKWIYMKESGFDVNATNPSSGAFGVPQFLGATKDAYLPSMSTDPAVQAEAGARYIRDRYGDPLAAKAFWEAHNWYDDGGWLPDGGLGINQSGKPEPVFTNPQWTLIKSLIISTAEMLDPLRLLVRDGRDLGRNIASLVRSVGADLAGRVDEAALQAWQALPAEVRAAVTDAADLVGAAADELRVAFVSGDHGYAALEQMLGPELGRAAVDLAVLAGSVDAAGRVWATITDRIHDKALAWSRGEWPIGSARVPTVEPGPGWEQFRLDDSLAQVARSNMALAEEVITGKVSPGSDPVANALFDIFGRDPLLPDLQRIAAGGANAVVAASEAAWHAFETGETARLEEWTASNSQLTEAVLRARDAAIVTGQMVEGAVNGYLNWAMASDSQGRMGSWQEYFQHYGGQYGTAEGDWLLSQVGFGGIVGGKVKDSLANLLIELAQSPLLSAPEILDDSGRVIGTQLQTDPAAGDPSAVAAPGPVDVPDMAALTAADPAEGTTDDATSTPAGGDRVVVVLPPDKSAFSRDEVEKMLAAIDEKVDEIEIRIEENQNAPAPLGAGVSGIV